jgi:hypothetical protein
MTQSNALTKERINLTNIIYIVQQPLLFEEQELLGCNDVVSGMSIDVSDERIPKYISTQNEKVISSSEVRRTCTGIHGYRTQKSVVCIVTAARNQNPKKIHLLFAVCSLSVVLPTTSSSYAIFAPSISSSLPS